MKKSKILSLVLAIMLIATFSIFTTKTYATEGEKLTTTIAEEGEELTTIGADDSQVDLDEDGHEHSEDEQMPDVHKGDLYVFFGEDDFNATTYVMDKMVDGNVFIFANDVKVTGTVNGSLYVFATKLTVDESAYIAMDLYAFAQEITMSGYAFDVYAACRSFDMTKTGVAYRDLKLAATDAHLIGGVGRDVDLTASNIAVYDDEENNFFVGNNFNYSSDKEIEHINDITVRGEVNFEKAEEKKVENTNVIKDYVIDAVKAIIFAIAIYAVLVFLAPKFIEKSREYVSTRGLLAAAIGLAFTILVPIVAFILLFTVIGVSLAFLCGFVYAAVLMISTAVVTIAINEFICGKVEKLNTTWKKILMIIPVSLVLFLIKQIPFLGGLVSIIVFFAGVGIVTLYQFDKRRKEKVTE